MDDNNTLKFNNQIIIIPIIAILIIWFVYWFEIKFGFNFNKYGIYPRSIKGLQGVLFSSFIHSGPKHLFNNSVPLFVLLISLFYFYREVALKVLLFGSLFMGLLTWLIARESYHIGASGVVYLLFGFVLFSGLFKKHYRLVALSLIIIFLYGSMIWYVLPVKDGMSWEGHLSGLMVGIFLALIYKNKGLIKKEHHFQKTDFDELFDEEGNFIPSIEESDNIKD